MNDQIEEMRKLGIPSVILTIPDDVLQSIAEGKYTLVFGAAKDFLNTQFQNILKDEDAALHKGVSLIVVDECHTVEMWDLWQIRSHIALKEETKLFVTCEGTGFREGTIGRRLSQFCEKSGLRLGDRLASVDWRKLVSKKTKEKATPAEAKLVRRVMAHSEITAERSYVRSNLTKLSAKAVKVIAGVTSVQQEKLKKGDADRDSPETSPPGPSGTSDQQISKDAASNITPGQETKTQERLLSFLVEQPDSSANAATKEKKEAIDRVFADNISRRQNVKMEDVQRKWQKDQFKSLFGHLPLDHAATIYGYSEEYTCRSQDETRSEYFACHFCLLKVNSNGVIELTDNTTDDYSSVYTAGQEVHRGHFFLRDNLIDMTHKIVERKVPIVQAVTARNILFDPCSKEGRKSVFKVPVDLNEEILASM
ncbi:hypothetical protein ACROYT_G014581 [Oculina patagonica]